MPLSHTGIEEATSAVIVAWLGVTRRATFNNIIVSISRLFVSTTNVIGWRDEKNKADTALVTASHAAIVTPVVTVTYAYEPIYYAVMNTLSYRVDWYAGVPLRHYRRHTFTLRRYWLVTPHVVTIYDIGCHYWFTGAIGAPYCH